MKAISFNDATLAKAKSRIPEVVIVVLNKLLITHVCNNASFVFIDEDKFINELFKFVSSSEFNPDTMSTYAFNKCITDNKVSLSDMIDDLRTIYCIEGKWKNVSFQKDVKHHPVPHLEFAKAK